MASKDTPISPRMSTQPKIFVSRCVGLFYILGTLKGTFQEGEKKSYRGKNIRIWTHQPHLSVSTSHALN